MGCEGVGSGGFLLAAVADRPQVVFSFLDPSSIGNTAVCPFAIAVVS